MMRRIVDRQLHGWNVTTFSEENKLEKFQKNFWLRILAISVLQLLTVKKNEQSNLLPNIWQVER